MVCIYNWQLFDLLHLWDEVVLDPLHGFERHDTCTKKKSQRWNLTRDHINLYIFRWKTDSWTFTGPDLRAVFTASCFLMPTVGEAGIKTRLVANQTRTYHNHCTWWPFCMQLVMRIWFLKPNSQRQSPVEGEGEVKAASINCRWLFNWLWYSNTSKWWGNHDESAIFWPSFEQGIRFFMFFRFLLFFDFLYPVAYCSPLVLLSYWTSPKWLVAAKR